MTATTTILDIRSSDQRLSSSACKGASAQGVKTVDTTTLQKVICGPWKYVKIINITLAGIWALPPKPGVRYLIHSCWGFAYDVINAGPQYIAASIWTDEGSAGNPAYIGTSTQIYILPWTSGPGTAQQIGDQKILDVLTSVNTGVFCYARQNPFENTQSHLYLAYAEVKDDASL